MKKIRAFKCICGRTYKKGGMFLNHLNEMKESPDDTQHGLVDVISNIEENEDSEQEMEDEPSMVSYSDEAVPADNSFREEDLPESDSGLEPPGQPIFRQPKDDKDSKMPMRLALWIEYSSTHSELIEKMRLLVNHLKASGADIKTFSISDIESMDKLIKLNDIIESQNIASLRLSSKKKVKPSFAEY